MFGLRLDAPALGPGAVQGTDGLNAAQQFHHGAVHLGFCVHQFHPDAFLGTDLPENDEGAHRNDQDDQAGHSHRQSQKDGHDGGQTGGNGRRKVHEDQLDQFDGAFQAAVESPMDVAGHMSPKIGQRCQQQRKCRLLPGILFRLGGGVLHNQATDDLDNLIDHIHQQNPQQNG